MRRKVTILWTNCCFLIYSVSVNIRHFTLRIIQLIELQFVLIMLL